MISSEEWMTDRRCLGFSFRSDLSSYSALPRKPERYAYGAFQIRNKIRKIDIPELSGGMRRRVAIARLLLLPSDSVFLDEPFQGLDGESKKIAASALLEYSQGKTMLFITHDEEDVSLLGAERVIRL